MTEVLTVLLYGFLALLGLFCLYSVACGLGRMKCAERMDVPYGFMAFLPLVRLWLGGKMAEKSDMIRNPDGKRIRWGVLSVVLEVTSSILAGVAGLSLLGATGAFFTSSNRFLRNLFSFIFAQTREEFVANTSRAVTVTAVLVTSAALLLILKDVVGYVTLYKTYAVFSKKGCGISLVISYFLPFMEPVFLLTFGYGRKALVAPTLSRKQRIEKERKEDEQEEPRILRLPPCNYGQMDA